MLNINEQYSALSGTEARNYQTIKFLGAGRIVDVYEVREIGTGQHFAAKIARSAADDEKIREEYDVLNKLEAIYKKNSIVYCPVPTGNQLLAWQLPQIQRTAPALLMPLITMSSLFDVYRDWQLSNPSRKENLGYESMVWKAARDYLGLIKIQIQELGQITTDRKRDTFLWDERDEKRNGLIVIDWNVMRPATQADQGVALQNFAQNWYSLFTSLRPDRLLDRLNDTSWRELSLAGRDLLLDLLSARSFTIDQTIMRLDELLGWIGSQSESQLQAAFKNAQSHWTHRPSSMSQAILRESGYERDFRVADMAWRQGIEGGEELYTEINRAWLSRGDIATSNEHLDTLIRQGNLDPLYADMQREVLSLLTTDPRNASNYRQALIDILEVFKNREITRTNLERLMETVTTARERLRRYNLDLTALKGIEGFIGLYQLVIELKESLTAGMVTEAQTHCKKLLAFDDSKTNFFGLSHRSINQIQNGLEQTQSADDLGDLQQKLVQAIAENKLGALEEEWLTLIERKPLSMVARHILNDYLKGLTLWRTLKTLPFYEGQNTYLVVEQLADLCRNMPDLRRYLGVLRFFTDLQAAYRKAYDGYQKNANPTASALSLSDNPDLDRATYLNRLLYRVIKG